MKTHRVHALVLALGAAALSLTVAAVAWPRAVPTLTTAPFALGSLTWPAAGAFAALLLLLQQQGFVFHWREHSTKVSLDELGVFLAVLVLPPPLVVLAVFGAAAANQIIQRRERSKALFNVAQYTVAALLAAASAAGIAAAGAPMPWQALVAPAVFSLATTFLVSLLFAAMDKAPVLQVLTQRFGGFVIVGSVLGASLGLVVVALFQLHPAAVLAAVPVFAYLRRFGRLSEWADDELTTHRVVASVSAEVAGSADLEAVAKRILSTCHELFDCGEASLVLSPAGVGTGAPRVWRASFGRVEGFGGVSADVPGPDGTRVGALSVFPRPGHPRYGERELQLLRTVAASAAAAAANAEALRRAGQANDELAASEDRYRSLFDTAHVLIHVLDADGRVVDANPAALAALGDTRGRTFDELCVSCPPLVEQLASDGEVVGLETQLRSALGRAVDVLVDAKSLTSGPDSTRIVVFARDITPLKDLEGELRRSMAQQHETIKRLENMNRELEQFTLWTTHDMREPLRSIGTIAGFLHEDIGSVSEDEARDMTRRIREGAERLKERVKALHAFSMIVQRDDEFQDVDMQRVVENVVTSLEARIAEKGAQVVLPARRLPVLRAQPHRIDQVVANLVENALKHGAAEGGLVEIGCEERANEWRFCVRDNGAGIPPGYHERIFQLFQRGPEPKESGSGAGLAIVKRIAEQHGGRAWVESTPGQGAAFYVALPKPATPAGQELVTLQKRF